MAVPPMGPLIRGVLPEESAHGEVLLLKTKQDMGAQGHAPPIFEKRATLLSFPFISAYFS